LRNEEKKHSAAVEYSDKVTAYRSFMGWKKFYKSCVVGRLFFYAMAKIEMTTVRKLLFKQAFNQLKMTSKLERNYLLASYKIEKTFKRRSGFFLKLRAICEYQKRVTFLGEMVKVLSIHLLF
jgi:hypothetical protein